MNRKKVFQAPTIQESKLRKIPDRRGCDYSHASDDNQYKSRPRAKSASPRLNRYSERKQRSRDSGSPPIENCSKGPMQLKYARSSTGDLPQPEFQNEGDETPPYFKQLPFRNGIAIQDKKFRKCRNGEKCERRKKYAELFKIVGNNNFRYDDCVFVHPEEIAGHLSRFGDKCPKGKECVHVDNNECIFPEH